MLVVSCQLLLKFYYSARSCILPEFCWVRQARLGALGLEVHITEMDLKCPEPDRMGPGCSLVAQADLAVGETLSLLPPPLPLAVVSVGIRKGVSSK